MTVRSTFVVLTLAALVACGARQPEPSTVDVAPASSLPEYPEVAKKEAKVPEAAPLPPATSPPPATLAPAPAVPPQVAAAAQALFDEGKKLMAQGVVPAACAKFEESLRLDRAMGTLLNLAACEELAGHTSRACALFHEVVRAAKQQGRDARAQFAADRATRLGCPP
jgi:hypothetical protein